MKFEIEEVPTFYQGYIQRVLELDLIGGLVSSEKGLIATCENLTEPEALHRYDDSKWSIKDIIQHLIDAERVFVYRAMRFARNDQTELSGFDQNEYVKEVFADRFSLVDLLKAFSNIRQSSLDLFNSFSETDMLRAGVSNGAEMTVEMIGYIIAGHTVHHTKIINERYLS